MPVHPYQRYCSFTVSALISSRPPLALVLGVSYRSNPVSVRAQDSLLRILPANRCESVSRARIAGRPSDVQERVLCARYVGLITMVATAFHPSFLNAMSSPRRSRKERGSEKIDPTPSRAEGEAGGSIGALTIRICA